MQYVYVYVTLHKVFWFAGCQQDTTYQYQIICSQAPALNQVVGAFANDLPKVGANWADPFVKGNFRLIADTWEWLENSPSKYVILVENGQDTVDKKEFLRPTTWDGFSSL